jgi:hypothetical protein
MKKIAVCLISSALAGAAFAQIASDDASNYTGGWSTGSNGGFGFLDWSLDNNDNGASVFGGNFIGNSTDGAGDINTGTNQSFGLFANPSAAFSTATRSFAAPLGVNDEFSFKMGVNFDNGAKGFNLRVDGDSVFNFNLGSGATVGSQNATLVAGPGSGYDYGGNDAMLDAVIRVIGADSFQYEISRVSSSGFQGVLFSGSVTGISSVGDGLLDNFEFYVSGTDDGSAQNNLYFNSLSVTQVPEPSAFGLLAGCFALVWVMLRRRS